MKKILLGQNKGKREVNEDNFINVELSSNAVVMPTDMITQTLDSYKEYLNEKDKSEIYRLIFTINPVCTNVLFNVITEVVYKEGSNDCTVLAGNNTYFQKNGEKWELYEYLHQCKGWGDGVNPIGLGIRHAVLDTGFSHPALGLTYHCGADIFDNHMLRKRGFSIINKMSADETERYNFNTIKDHLRDADGKQIRESRPIVNNYQVVSTTIDRHVYQIDDVKTFTESLTEGLVEENGWKGFINPVSLNIPNVFLIHPTGLWTEALTINKCMNDRNAGDFIDMYPDRTLYSFVPKYNKYRDRLEYNWDCFITYPSYEYTGHTLVADRIASTGEYINGIECVFVNIEEEAAESYFAKGAYGKTNFIVHLKTKYKNTFYKGSFVNISFFFNNKANVMTTDTVVKVENIGHNGEDSQHVFSVNFDSIFSSIKECITQNSIPMTNWVDVLKSMKMRVRKNVKGADCIYYVRYFKKLPNINNNNKITTNKDGTSQFSNSLNKLAFAENIYSDEIAQIVFNDDIITSGITCRRHNGDYTHISELYLTIIKRNKGYKEWYRQNTPIYNKPYIEFSHCFGQVTSGLDLGPEWEKYNVHYITKDNYDEIAVETDITDESGDGGWSSGLIGDITEFSPYTLEEATIEPIYYRFNTAQRETDNPAYGTLTYSQFVHDDYDVTSGSFRVEERSFIVGDESGSTNICDEGYYYQPHYKIKLKSYDNEVKQGRHIKLSFKEGCEPTLVSGNTYEFTTNVPCYLVAGNKIFLIEPNTGNEMKGTVTTVDGFLGMHITFTANNVGNITKFDIYKPNPAKPEGAYELKDGTGRYLWREMLSDNKILPGDELYDSTFTNGAHYFHKNINFYLKRQDPLGIYGLNGSYAKNGKGNMDAINGSAEGKKKDVSFAEYTEETEGDIC